MQLALEVGSALVLQVASGWVMCACILDSGYFLFVEPQRSSWH